MGLCRERERGEERRGEQMPQSRCSKTLTVGETGFKDTGVLCTVLTTFLYILIISK